MAKTVKPLDIVRTADVLSETMDNAMLEHAKLELEKAQIQSERLEERLSRLDLYLDHQGWSPGNMDDQGPTLTQVQQSSQRTRNLTALNTWVKRGRSLRQAYIWQGGIHYDDIPDKADGRSSTPNVQARIDSPVNQKYFFGVQAREEREGCLYTDGQAFYLGDDDDKTLRTIPIWEISDTYRNPDFHAEVWAVRRTWQHFPQGSVNPETRSEWYFLNGFWDKNMFKSVRYNGALEPVSQTKRIFTINVNSMTDWAWGLPDALAGLAWAEKYTRALQDGLKQQSAMAQIWAQAKANTQAGANDMAVKIGQGGTGGVAITGQANSITPLSTAGNGYDFESLRPIISAFYTGIDISVVAGTSDPGAAGSSYGSAQTLERPETLTAEARRKLHVELDIEVLKWLGAESPKVWFDPITDATEHYREDQRIALRANTGVFSGEEVKKMFLENDGLTVSTGDVKIPDGYLTPNNRDSLQRKDIDTDGQATTPSAGQGQANGSGGQGSTLGNDGRTDTLT